MFLFLLGMSDGGRVSGRNIRQLTGLGLSLGCLLFG